jgi:DNA-binding transcriptional ArsR family regulator
MPKPGPKRLSDPQELRALAHPLRLRLLTELAARRHGTASELAAAVGEPANRVSFHLRLLARYGFLEEAPEHARDRRERCWRLVHEDGMDYDALETTPEGVAALHAHLRKGMGEAHAMAEAFFAGRLDGATPWERGPFAHDWYLRLTQGEATEFDEEYLALCFRWRERIAARLDAGDTDGRETFAVFIQGFPLPKGATVPDEHGTLR